MTSKTNLRLLLTFILMLLIQQYSFANPAQKIARKIDPPAKPITQSLSPNNITPKIEPPKNTSNLIKTPPPKVVKQVSPVTSPPKLVKSGMPNANAVKITSPKAGAASGGFRRSTPPPQQTKLKSLTDVRGQVQKASTPSEGLRGVDKLKPKAKREAFSEARVKREKMATDKTAKKQRSDNKVLQARKDTGKKQIERKGQITKKFNDKAKSDKKFFDQKKANQDKAVAKKRNDDRVSKQRLADNKGQASKGKSKNANEMADELSKKINKNSVSFTTPSQKGHIDLRGRSHFDKKSQVKIDTPHVQTRDIKVGSNGQISVPKKTEVTRLATKQDIRTAKKLAKKQGLLEDD